MLRFLLLCFPFLLGLPCSFSQKNLVLESPDNNLRFTLHISDRILQYEIQYKGKPILQKSNLGILLAGGVELTQNLNARKMKTREGLDEYELIVGKTNRVRENYREGKIALRSRSRPKWKFNLITRAYNEGIAIRYVFPKQKSGDTLLLAGERSCFNYHGDPQSMVLLRQNFITSHEGLYTHEPLSRIQEDTLIDLPALFITPDTIYTAITEAALSDYAGMYLNKRNGVLTSALSPLPNKDSLKVKASLPHQSPWRVILVSDRMGALIESNILTNLSPSNKIKNASWIKPGKTTFPWWNGNILPDSIAGGNNFETNKYYIDFCARNGIEYHSIVEYGGHQWYIDDGQVYQPGPNADVTTPVPGLDMKKVCDYALSQGVKPRVWVHWAALYPKIDIAFALFESWGITGMMIDFMDRDDQNMVRIQEEMLEKAARHKLHVQFHGAYKPTGMSRTWPNELTREGTLNYEVHKWDSTVTPDHDLDLAFTRMLAGPADCHLGGFRAVPRDSFKIQYIQPLVQGTRCHLLGMYVVMESYLQIISDYPAAYEGQPGFEFLKEVPTSWDETRVLAAVPRQYVVIARKRGESWYIGAINNHEAREISIPLHFLQAGHHTLDIYTDANDVEYFPNHLLQEEKQVTATDVLTIRMGSGGGMAGKISPVR